jgi:hypothetical protein
MTIEILGLLGGAGFAVSGIPTAITAYKEGKVSFIPRLTQWSVLLGAILTITYLLLKNGFDWVISLDYAITIISWLIIIKYEYFPRKGDLK